MKVGEMDDNPFKVVSLAAFFFGTMIVISKTPLLNASNSPVFIKNVLFMWVRVHNQIRRELLGTSGVSSCY